MSDPKDDAKSANAAKPDAGPSKGAMILSALALTPESALEVFRARRIPDSKLEVGDLKRAREILVALGTAITTPTATGPDLVERLWHALQDCAGERADTGNAPKAAATPAAPPELVQSAAHAGTATAAASALPDHSLPPRPPLLGAVPAATPWAPPLPRASPLAPSVPPPPAALPTPPRPRAVAGLDVATLNRVRLDESAPATLGLDAAAPAAPVLPFRAPEAEAIPAPVASAGPKSPALGGSTVSVGTMSPLAHQTLPFQKMEGVEEALAAERRTSSDAHTEEVPAEEPTAMLDRGGLRAQANAPLAPPSIAEAPESTVRLHAAAMPPAPLARSAPPVPPPRESSRGRSDLLAHLATMTVEQHASLSAECAVNPDRIAQIHAQHQVLTDDQRAALDQHWRERMAASQELTRLWQWHYTRYEQWFRQQRR